MIPKWPKILVTPYRGVSSEFPKLVRSTTLESVSKTQEHWSLPKQSLLYTDPNKNNCNNVSNTKGMDLVVPILFVNDNINRDNRKLV